MASTDQRLAYTPPAPQLTVDQAKTNIKNAIPGILMANPNIGIAAAGTGAGLQLGQGLVRGVERAADSLLPTPMDFGRVTPVAPTMPPTNNILADSEAAVRRAANTDRDVYTTNLPTAGSRPVAAPVPPPSPALQGVLPNHISVVGGGGAQPLTGAEQQQNYFQQLHKQMANEMTAAGNDPVQRSIVANTWRTLTGVMGDNSFANQSNQRQINTDDNTASAARTAADNLTRERGQDLIAGESKADREARAPLLEAQTGSASAATLATQAKNYEDEQVRTYDIASRDPKLTPAEQAEAGKRRDALMNRRQAGLEAIARINHPVY